jgi:type 9 secretion system plug protein
LKTKSYHHFIFIFVLLLANTWLKAQIPDYVYKPNIRSITFTKFGEPYGYPVISLNSGDVFELNFDDMDADLKTYYYTYQLCNADWSPSTLFSFDYIRGFQNMRITTYRSSSIALTRYTHYQAVVPDRNCYPIRSGNYLLKVFLDGDTSKIVFTRRFLVVNDKSKIAATIRQPMSSRLFQNYQKVVAGITLNPELNVFNQQEVKVVILQNYSWPNAIFLERPNIFHGNYFEYNDENTTTFPAGKEWRWIDLRSLRLMTDRMQKIDKKTVVPEVYVKPDGDREKQPYMFYRDLDGLFYIATIDNVNPFWQSDYAKVHFTFVPPGNRAFEGRNLYLYGALTNYTPDDSSKMIFNEEKGIYEKTLFLKQGYYDYSYITIPDKPTDDRFSYDNTEGNFWGTQNSYMIMVYYRAYGSRADELIGFTSLLSAFQSELREVR